MAFSRPTLAELVARIREDLRTRMELSGGALVAAVLRRAVVHISATVWAGAVHMLHGHLDWIYRQAFPTLSERDALIEYAKRFGDLAPKAATFASGTVTATGTSGTIPEGQALRRSDGERFEVTVGDAIDGGTATVTVEAVNPGALGNTDAGFVLTFESPISGVDSDATVAAGGLTGGNDEEDTEDFRARVLDREREPPQGGADHDYVAWALEVAGVTRAWVYPYEDASGNQGVLGTVTVRFVRDDDASLIPDAGEVAAVQAKLDEERPVTAEVTAKAPTTLPIDFEIDLTIGAGLDPATVQGEVTAELEDLLLNQAAPGDGLGQGTIYLSQIQAAVGNVGGVTDFSVTVPAADVVPSLGAIAVMGAAPVYT